MRMQQQMGAAGGASGRAARPVAGRAVGARAGLGGVRHAAAVVALLAGGAAMGQSLHTADMVLRIGPTQQLETGVFENGAVAFVRRVIPAQLGIEGFRNFTNDPGWDSPSGTFVPGTGVGYTILGSLKEWNGTDFTGTSDERLVLRRFGMDRVTPLDESEVPGLVIGTADSVGKFHHHVQYFFQNFSAPAFVGNWLLTLRLWTDDGTAAASEPLYIVFTQGSLGQAEQAEALAWVNANLVNPASCPADYDGDGEPATIFDLFEFLADLDAGADYDGDGEAATIFDLFEFLADLDAGCP